MMKKFSMMFAAVSLLACCTLAQAGIIGAHSGAADPAATEGWTLDAGGGTPTVSSVTDELQAWQIQCGENVQGRYLYGTDAATLGNASGWTMTGVIKVNSTSGNVSDCNIGVLDSANWWTINLTESGVHTWGSGHGYYQTISSMDPTDGYHVYQIVYDPSQNGVGYYVDGTLAGTQGRSTAPPGYGIYRGEFGDANGLGATDSQWAAVVLETGQTIYSSVSEVPGVSVPEPSTLAMLVAGIFGMVMVYQRKR